ncbi:MAG: FimV/HubP family polar landmark protein [Pseudomonadota bacterium]
MRRKVLSAAASLLVVLPGASHALGLGDIQLKSTLNAPLDAEIELIGATPEELAGLKVQMASRDEFARHGLDYPSFLTGITLRTVRSGDGRNLIRLSSAGPITEPFATLLVEANWARGRYLREYTVLLDPPVFTPAGATAAPVAAAVTGGGERSGGIARPAAPAVNPAPPPAEAAPRPAAAPAGISGDSYEVRRGDTLSRIAAGVVGSDAAEQRRAMIAIYRGNLSAFDGNINLLRSGAVIRLPDPTAIAAISPSEATAEVRRQAAAWQANRVAGGAAPAEDARLRLVPPPEAAPASPTAPSPAPTPGAAAASQALQQRVAELERQLSESRRLLELRSAELAQLQAQPGAAATPVPATPPAVEPPAVEPPAATPPVAETPAVPPAAAPTPAAPVAAEPAAPAGPSLVDRLKEFWFVPAGLILLLLVILGLRKARARRENAFDRSLGGFGGDTGAARDYSSDTLPLRKPNIGKDDESFLVEESGAHERPSFGGRTATRKVDVEEPTPLAASPVADATGLEQGDPLAEADFHMAYGLYDQAADLVRLAIQREPQRRDLKLKLLEVFFVWGNKEQFLQTARDLAGTREQSQPGEWEKVVIMGKQLAPDDALFAQSGSGAGAAAAGVDLNLEGGQNRIDFDLLGEPSVEQSTEGVDLDLGAALGDQDPTGDAPVLNKDDLDFPLDDPTRGSDRGGNTATTRQMAQPLRDGAADYSPTVQMASPDSEGPTVEQPTLGGETIRQKVDVALKYGAPDQTAELALDDLGLDLGALENTDEPSLDDSRIVPGLGSPEAPTLVAGLDDESRRLIAEAQDFSGSDVKIGESGTWLFNEKDFLDPAADTGKADANATMAMPQLPEDAPDASPTARLRAMEAADLDINIDQLATTGRHEAPSADSFGVDLDVGLPDPNAVTGYQSTQRIDSNEMTLPDLEPVTMSEVGTKLDLARAYMDMGDPDGARSILSEVLQEGSANQKQEAQRLLDSIPG